MPPQIETTLGLSFSFDRVKTWKWRTIPAAELCSLQTQSPALQPRYVYDIIFKAGYMTTAVSNICKFYDEVSVHRLSVCCEQNVVIFLNDVFPIAPELLSYEYASFHLVFGINDQPRGETCCYPDPVANLYSQWGPCTIGI